VSAAGFNPALDKFATAVVYQMSKK
jgi:hypothetical protein